MLAPLTRIPGHPVDVVDTTGAGDCFVGVLAASLATGLSLEAALHRANRAAAISVTRQGAGSSMRSPPKSTADPASYPAAYSGSAFRRFIIS